MRRTVPWLTATPESSVAFTPLHELDGIITPNGLCFERHHSGIAEIDPNDYRLCLLYTSFVELAGDFIQMSL